MPRAMTAEHVVEAERLIDPVFLNSPVIRNAGIDRALGLEVLIKNEAANPIGSFKGRGAEYFCATREMQDHHLVCASAGNFGQAMTWAARRRGGRVSVFAATSANPMKVARMRELGATVELVGSDFEAANATAKAFARDRGATFVEDADYPEIGEGAGTMAKELTDAGLAFEAMFVPVGGAAMINGIGTWLKHARPDCKVIGVCAEGAPAYALSWRARKVISTPTASTIADGIMIREPVLSAIETMLQVVDDVVLVSEDDILAAMRMLHREAGLIAEGAGAAGLAAIARHAGELGIRSAAFPLCGANLTAEQRRSYLGMV